MTKRLILVSVVAGLISGAIIGVFFKVIEHTLNSKVYTLLLNIDFIPIVNQVNFPEVVEFTFHLIVSVLLTMILFLVTNYFQWIKQRPTIMLTAMSMIVGIFIFPITHLSPRTPDIFSLSAIFWWVIGHALYGMILSSMFNKNAKRFQHKL